MNSAQMIQKIWQERVNQNIDSALILFAELKGELGLNQNQKFSDLAINSLTAPSVFCDCLSLESSLFRAQKKQEFSAQAISRIENDIPIAIFTYSFIYQFEKAIVYFADSNWVEAVHYFLKAKKLAHNSLQKTTCLINLILCSENLDVTYANALAELIETVKQLDSNMRQGIDSQIDSLLLRNKWRNNKLTPADYVGLDARKLDQSSYFLTYISQIPYVSKQHDNINIEEFISKPGHLFNKDFRIRTLAYQWSDLDLTNTRLSDHIERIYLWTWKWMENPQKNNVNHLVCAINAFPWKSFEQIDKLSPDNQSLLLLTIGWLSYFDNSMFSIYQAAEIKIKFATNNKFLMKEKDTLILALATQKDELSTANEALPVLADLHAKVDNSRNTIKYGNKIVHSKSLCLAVSLLVESDNIEVETLFNKTLSPVEYDSYLNAHQISNMIYKLNNILNPVLQVKQKNGLIFAIGNKESIQIIYADPRAKILTTHESWLSLVKFLRTEFLLLSECKAKSRKRKYVVMLEKYQQIFKRQNLQKELNISKTEATRLLRHWIAEKLISKKGFSKRTIYLFASNNMRSV